VTTFMAPLRMRAPKKTHLHVRPFVHRHRPARVIRLVGPQSETMTAVNFADTLRRYDSDESMRAFWWSVWKSNASSRWDAWPRAAPLLCPIASLQQSSKKTGLGQGCSWNLLKSSPCQSAWPPLDGILARHAPELVAGIDRNTQSSQEISLYRATRRTSRFIQICYRPRCPRPRLQHFRDQGTGNVNWNVAPRGMSALAHNRPPCASMIEWQIDRPIPKPPGLVV
jgi:hypothetical protein